MKRFPPRCASAIGLFARQNQWLTRSPNSTGLPKISLQAFVPAAKPKYENGTAFWLPRAAHPNARFNAKCSSEVQTMNCARVIHSVETGLDIASEHSLTGRFANSIAKSGDFQSSGLRSISSGRETRVSWMGEIIVSPDGYFCSPGHNFDWKHAGVSRAIPQRARSPGQWRRRSSAGISCAGNDHCPTRFAAQTLATTVKRFGAVSSVVERLVYTDTLLIFPHYNHLI